MKKVSDSLELVDQRVVAALQINPRAGVAEMGRILGEHERSVARRVQRLTAEGVVHSTAEYDPSRCGLGHTVQVHLKAPRGSLEDVAGGLAKRSDVLNLAAVSGKVGHLWCEVLVPSRPLLHSLAAEGIPGLYDVEMLSTHITLRHFKTEAQWHAPVLTEEEQARLQASMVHPLPAPAGRYELTPTDERVAASLISDARISLTDIARQLDFSTATAGRRVAALLERQVLHLHTTVDPALVGYPVEARIRLKIHPGETDTVGEALAACPRVRRCAAVTGQHNLLADVCLEDETCLYDILVDELAAFPRILDIETEIVTHTYKRGPVLNSTPR
ncbi:Lrp/AsnC family transcriptional regulator [Streptomyces sp. NPDC051644]|uniref:Lrp/AsnC family transcriptional regulator n=1 Tax=Streptomyces sp. NPDC051644 TaxID=3365666 RepID=UPI0037B7868D